MNGIKDNGIRSKKCSIHRSSYEQYSPDQIYCEHTKLEFYVLLPLVQYRYHAAEVYLKPLDLQPIIKDNQYTYFLIQSQEDRRHINNCPQSTFLLDGALCPHLAYPKLPFLLDQDVDMMSVVLLFLLLQLWLLSYKYLYIQV